MFSFELAVCESTQVSTSHTPIITPVLSSSDEDSLGDSEAEFAKSDDDGDSSPGEVLPERGSTLSRRRGRGRGLNLRCGRVGRGRVGRGRGRHGRGKRRRGMGVRRGTGRLSSPLTKDQLILEGPWTREESRALNYSFSGDKAGPSIPTDSSTSAMDLFFRFFTDEVWELITTETNTYAAKLRDQSHHTSPRPWNDVSVKEMKTFIGILILMGICRLPRLRLYWTKQHPYICPAICEIMSLTRFEQIYRFLHLCDSNNEVAAGQPGHDYLFKVRDLLDLLSPRFLSQYHTHEELSVDEAMIPFKGRLGIKQYMKDKPTKWGIKVFVLADARTGYTVRLQIYTGKNSNLVGSDTGLCSRVVLELLDGLEDKCPKVYMDNYYTSPELFLSLYNKGVNACGTARSNRKHFPKDLKVDKRVSVGYYDFRSSGPLLACVWKDKRIIHFLSTIHVARASSTVTVLRREKDGSKRIVECPPLLPDYQAFMRGIDRGDQLMGYYNVGRRSKKWWKRVFAYLLEVCVLNSYILQKVSNSGAVKQDFLNFRLTLAVQLVGTSRKSQGGRPRTLENSTLRLDITQSHLPEYVSHKRDCVVCCKVRLTKGLSRSQFRHESAIKCSTCDVHLCLSKDRNCYKIYHTQVDYS